MISPEYNNALACFKVVNAIRISAESEVMQTAIREARAFSKGVHESLVEKAANENGMVKARAELDEAIEHLTDEERVAFAIFMEREEAKGKDSPWS